MRHQPGSVDAPLSAPAIALAVHARAGRLAIYAGAGLSYSQPTSLPNGAALALLVHTRLSGAFLGLSAVPTNDLVAISDFVAALPGGEDALRQAIVEVAEFATAEASYGHKVLALLILEGVVDVLTTNWDDCIERGYSPERVQAVVNQHDLANISGPSVLKIHGCATQPGTLLLTRDHLRHPPTWVVDQTRARLGAAVVVFVGIGDVADYVAEGLAEAVADVGSLNHIRVVSPSVITKWATSQWATATPNLPAENKIAATSDSFLESLACAYLYLSFQDMRAAVAGSPHETPMNIAIQAFTRNDAVTLLSWIRRSSVVSKAGKSLLLESTAASSILAIGTLVGDTFTISRDGVLDTPDGPIDTIIALGHQPATRLRREAQDRLEARAAMGLEAPRYLISGGMGWPSEISVLPDDIMGEGGKDDILDGPSSQRPVILRAEQVAA